MAIVIRHPYRHKNGKKFVTSFENNKPTTSGECIPHVNTGEIFNQQFLCWFTKKNDYTEDMLMV